MTDDNLPTVAEEHNLYDYNPRDARFREPPIHDQHTVDSSTRMTVIDNGETLLLHDSDNPEARLEYCPESETA